MTQPGTGTMTMHEAIQNVSLKQLRAVQAVARYSSFLAAAAELQMSQPGVSRLVRSLEEALDCTLFHRSTRHVILTEEGLALLPTIDRVLAEMDVSFSNLSSSKTLQPDHVVMACPLTIANRMLAEPIGGLRRAYPLATLEIREALRSAVIQQVRHGTVDFALGSFVESDDDMHVEDLCEVDYRVIFPLGHRFEAQSEVALSELRDEPIISLPPSSILRTTFDGAAARRGFRLRHMITVNTIGTIFDLVEKRHGVALQSNIAVAGHPGRVGARQIVAPTILSRLKMIRHRERKLSAAALEMMAQVRQKFVGFHL